MPRTPGPLPRGLSLHANRRTLAIVASVSLGVAGGAACTVTGATANGGAGGTATTSGTDTTTSSTSSTSATSSATSSTSATTSTSIATGTTASSTSASSTATSSSSSGTPGPCTPGVAPSNAFVVDVCTQEQVMDGFGAANTWAAPLTAAQVTLFFDPTNGIGLSLLRIGIDGSGAPLGSGAYADSKAVAKYGVKVWAAPWSPPAADKSNNNTNNGGTLNASAYGSWSDVLAAFPAKFKQNTGTDLYGISAQNEPDFTASYASCIYSAAQMVAFVKVLGPKLAALNPPVQLLAAEPDVWDHMWVNGDKYGTAILADAQASAAVNILATHDYGHKNDSVTTRPSPPEGTKQHIWETEMSDETAADVDIAHGIQVATWIYAGVTTGRASAWHYWWLINANTDGEGLLLKGGDTTNPPKRLYTMGNYSKYIRPGYVRVNTMGTTPTGLLVSAFQNPADGTVVIVAINPGTSAATLPVFVSGGNAITQVTPWVTSANDNLAAKAPIPVAAGSFSATLDAQTVTTFVGK